MSGRNKGGKHEAILPRSSLKVCRNRKIKILSRAHLRAAEESVLLENFKVRRIFRLHSMRLYPMRKAKGFRVSLSALINLKSIYREKTYKI